MSLTDAIQDYEDKKGKKYGKYFYKGKCVRSYLNNMRQYNYFYWLISKKKKSINEAIKIIEEKLPELLGEQK